MFINGIIQPIYFKIINFYIIKFFFYDNFKFRYKNIWNTIKIL